MEDTPNTSPEKPKKKIITVGENKDGERSTGESRDSNKGRRGGRGRDRDERKPAVSAALMRGPKPKPKAEEVPEEAVAEAMPEEAVAEKMPEEAVAEKMPEEVVAEEAETSTTAEAAAETPPEAVTDPEAASA
ncbi:MAG: hypothetical protein WBB18_03585 [Nodosilinea sp.]